MPDHVLITLLSASAATGSIDPAPTAPIICSVRRRVIGLCRFHSMKYTLQLSSTILIMLLFALYSQSFLYDDLENKIAVPSLLWVRDKIEGPVDLTTPYGETPGGYAIASVVNSVIKNN